MNNEILNVRNTAAWSRRQKTAASRCRENRGTGVGGDSREQLMAGCGAARPMQYYQLTVPNDMSAG